jgi:hypothetical protein
MMVTNPRMKGILLVCFLLIAAACSAQRDSSETTAKNSFHLELFGSSYYFYNLTYERILLNGTKGKLSSGLGFQLFPAIPGSDGDIFSFTPQVNYFFGVKHHFETGIGVCYFLNNEEIAVPLRVGYRFQKPEGGFLFKFALTPTFVPDFFGEAVFLPWAGAGIGFAF